MPFPIAESELRKTEEKIGAMFPDAYRKAMMQNNGGTIEVHDDSWDLFPLYDQSSNKAISRTCNDILRETKSAQEWSNYHENAYAIAGNGTGDLLVIFRKGVQFEPPIYIWQHIDGALITVANDFSELKRV